MNLYIDIMLAAFMITIAIRNVSHRKMSRKEMVLLYALLCFAAGFFALFMPLKQYSSFSVIAVICLYGTLFHRETRPQNICMGLLGFVLCVVIDNIFSGIWSIAFHDFAGGSPYYWPYGVLFHVLLTCVLTYFCGKVMHHYLFRNKLLLQIRQVWYLADVTLLFCALVFAFNNVAGEKVGYPVSVVYFNCLLFAGYFVLMLFLLVSVFRAYQEKIRVEEKQKSFRELQDYTRNLESMYNSVRSFKHDYINILTSMSGYIEQGDIQGLKVFFQAKILPTRDLITQGDYKLNQLSNIEVLEIKSLLSAKMIYAHESGINVTIDIPSSVQNFGMDTVDLARVLGIFLDNAIEAALETAHPKIGLNIIKNPETVAIIILNSFQACDLPLHKLKQIGVSTKVNHPGIGLSNAQEIISSYDNVLWETDKQGDYFTQYMEIFFGKE